MGVQNGGRFYSSDLLGSFRSGLLRTSAVARLGKNRAAPTWKARPPSRMGDYYTVQAWTGVSCVVCRAKTHLRSGLYCRKRGPSSFERKCYNNADPQHRGNQTNSDQYAWKILGRLTNNAARDFRHTLT